MPNGLTVSSFSGGPTDAIATPATTKMADTGRKSFCIVFSRRNFFDDDDGVGVVGRLSRHPRLEPHF
jgi:hypothetical protein